MAIDVLITRPLDDGKNLALKLDEQGFSSFVEPVFDVLPTKHVPPALDDISGLIFTSANGVRFSVHSAVFEQLKNLPVYIVGKKTGSVAQMLGYTNVQLIAPTVTDLLNTLRGRADSFLYVRGLHVRTDLKTEGIPCQEWIVYQAKERAGFSKEFKDLITSQRFRAIAFYSARTAAHFLKLCQQENYTESFARTKALCLSEAVQSSAKSMVWDSVHVATRPDTPSMMALIKQEVKGKSTAMTYSTDARALTNAEEIIKRFGGIRPMASKTDVPVTTIQGWKKRNVIPANRYEEIMKAAEEHNVDLSGLVETESKKTERVQGAPSQNKEEDVSQTVTNQKETQPHSDLKVKPVSTGANTPRQNVACAHTNKFAFGIIVVLVALLFGGLFWLGPGIQKRSEEQQQRIAELEKQIEEVKEEHSTLSSIIPGDLKQQIGALKKQTMQVKEAVETLSGEATLFSEGIMGENAGTLNERLVRLEAQVGRFAEMTGSEGLANMMGKINALQQTVQGQELLTQSVYDLQNIMTKTKGQEDLIEPALEEAQANKTALGQTLEGVSNDDLKAAAMLLGLSQFRHSLARDNESFEEDLDVMRGMIGEDNQDLQAAIDRLSPHAQNGVLTPGGLSEEFKSFAGEIVVSSLKGEDVSVQEKAVARLNDIFQVEKDGELVTGTDTQMTVAAAQKLLDQGDVTGAIEVLQQLEGPAAKTAEPFMEQAQTTVLANQVQDMVTSSVLEKVLQGRDLSQLNASGLKGLINEFKDFVPQGVMIEDPASGMKIYKKHVIPGQ